MRGRELPRLHLIQFNTEPAFRQLHGSLAPRKPGSDNFNHKSSETISESFSLNKALSVILLICARLEANKAFSQTPLQKDLTNYMRKTLLLGFFITAAFAGAVNFSLLAGLFEERSAAGGTFFLDRKIPCHEITVLIVLAAVERFSFF